MTLRVYTVGYDIDKFTPDTPLRRLNDIYFTPQVLSIPFRVLYNNTSPRECLVNYALYTRPFWSSNSEKDDLINTLKHGNPYGEHIYMVNEHIATTLTHKSRLLQVIMDYCDDHGYEYVDIFKQFPELNSNKWV